MKSKIDRQIDAILKPIAIGLLIVAIGIIFYGERHFTQTLQSNKKIFAEDIVVASQDGQPIKKVMEDEAYQELPALMDESTVAGEVYSGN